LNLSLGNELPGIFENALLLAPSYKLFKLFHDFILRAFQHELGFHFLYVWVTINLLFHVLSFANFSEKLIDVVVFYFREVAIEPVFDLSLAKLLFFYAGKHI